MLRRVEVRLALMVIACLGLTGCGSDAPTTGKVTGTVMHKGQPVEGAAVIFTPKSGRPATAITDAQGKFDLQTSEPGDGAVLGEHIVTISPNANEQPPMPGTPEAKNYKAPTSTIPKKYSDPTKSGITKTVTDGDNDFTIEVD